MSRGLRAGVMAAPAPRRTLTKEADEELALFFEMRKLEKERSNKPLHNASEIDLPLGNTVLDNYFRMGIRIRPFISYEEDYFLCG